VEKLKVIPVVMLTPRKSSVSLLIFCSSMYSKSEEPEYPAAVSAALAAVGW
jgi:hypothetical protein